VYAPPDKLFTPKPSNLQSTSSVFQTRSDLWSASSIGDIERIRIVRDVVNKYNAQFEN